MKSYKTVGGFYTVAGTGAPRFYYLTTAITANSTTTTAPAGSKGFTTNATGRASAFVSDGTKWQFLTNA